MPVLGGGTRRGDQWVTLRIDIPKNLSVEAEKLVKELDVLLQGSKQENPFFKRWFR
jgi:DnaJ-class molecular chaperone